MDKKPDAQYHHFVPQFLLRNFSHPYRPPIETGKKAKKSGKNFKKGMFRGDLVVSHIDLTVEPFSVSEKPVKRILGSPDMYRDTTKATDKQQEVERMLSRFESQASAVFRKIRCAHEQNQGGLWLTRDEKDVIRKFLFILKYRGSGYYRRFYHEVSDTYDSDDRKLLLSYMKDKGYKRPLDVWFDNLKAIMEIRMDPNGEWTKELPKRMFPLDAVGFISHVNNMYMSICTPACVDEEFILADNSYNVFEGPNWYTTEESSGIDGIRYTPLHTFAPISPKLMIVLRCVILPVPEEDADERVKTFRDMMRSSVLDDLYPWDVKSLLADLPIAKARNNYTVIVDGRLYHLDGEDGRMRKDHKFLFSFFPINSEYVNLINAIIFDNASTCTSIVFGSQAALVKTLKYYLVAPCRIGKRFSAEDKDSRFSFFNKLVSLGRNLGLEVDAIWEFTEFPTIPNYRDFINRQADLAEACQKIIGGDYEKEVEEEYRPIYEALGGSQDTLVYDLEQAHRMWLLRVKLDSWSQGIDESVRERNRDVLLHTYFQLPPQRVWLYLKCMRFAFFSGGSLDTRFKSLGCLPFMVLHAPEDIIARGRSTSRIVDPDRISSLLHQVALNDLETTRSMDILSDECIQNIPELMIQFIKFQQTCFSIPGFIRDCGIPEVEGLALVAQQVTMSTGSWAEVDPENPFLDGENRIEIMTRVMTRLRFVEVLSGQLDHELLQELEEVFFEVAYPDIMT